ncbi:iron-sulfur cluster assembly scaffold protein [Francisellaceae bacterium]|nr:iron-sulfur cluster assembly scaffold protein [Francisellaceae bacterium]
MIYTKKIIELYHKASLEPLFDQSDSVSEYHYGDEPSGLYIIFQIKVKHGAVSNCRYKVLGCGYAIALCVWLAERLDGKSKQDLSAIELSDLISRFDIPKTKHKVAIAILNLYEQILDSDA